MRAGCAGMKLLKETDVIGMDLSVASITSLMPLVRARLSYRV